MGETIEFPNNDLYYLQKAKTEMQNGHTKAAIESVEQAYAHSKSVEVNAVYVSILVAAEKYNEAVLIADDFEERYREDEHYKLLYLFLLIKAQKVDEAEEFMEILQQQSSVKGEELEKMQGLLEEEKKQLKEQHAAFLEETKQKLFGLADRSMDEQLQIIEQAAQLDNDTLAGAAPFIFSNPYTNHVIRSIFLQTLIKNQVDCTIHFSLNELAVDINPSRLIPFEENEKVKALNEQLERQLEKNPSLLMALKPEMNFQLLKIFPFTDQIIKNTDKWVELFIGYYSNEETPEQSVFKNEEKEMADWIRRLSD